MKRAKNEARSRSTPTALPAGAGTKSHTGIGTGGGSLGRAGTPGNAQVTSIVVPVLAPRNPYQLLARQRRAGAHDVDARKRRRGEKSELRRLREE